MTQKKSLPKKSNNKLKASLVIALLLLLGFGFWYFYHSRKDNKAVDSYAACVNAGNPVQDIYPAICVTKDGKSFTDPHVKKDDPKLVPPLEVAPTYLQLKEWNLRVPVSEALNDLTYMYVQNDSYESMFFTFKRLQNADMCKTDVGVAMSRSKTENQPPYNIDNPAVFMHVGDYYYYLAYGGAYCYNLDNAEQVSLVKTIEPNGDLIKAVKSQLQKLEVAQ